MSVKVCLAANTVDYPWAGGFMWIYLNWALGFRALGCDVIWLEQLRTLEGAEGRVVALKDRLRPYGFEQIALLGPDGTPYDGDATDAYIDLEAAAEAEVLFNMAYGLGAGVIDRFKHSALLDIDPGLCQLWLSKGWIEVAPHDVYLTIGETVGRPGSLFPDAGLEWHHVPPSVALDCWTNASDSPSRPFTTVSSWDTYDEWMEDDDGYYSNDKRDGFLPFLDLPSLTQEPIELALALPDEGAPAELTERGWGVVDSAQIAGKPWDYWTYVRSSRGEFSCVKPSCVRLQNAWISDRTICYLASGRPAVIEDTGPSGFLPDGEGLHRFRTVEEAADRLERVAEDYEHQSTLARKLAEEHFDARRNAGRVLELAMAVSARSR
jgi:hypothetical protein